MSINRLRTLCVEIYKTLKELNPSFYCKKKPDRHIREQYKLNLYTSSNNQMTNGYKSLLIFRPKIWNKPPYHIKSSENLKSFKELIKKLGFYTLQLKSLQKEFLIFGICFHNLVHALEK